MNQRITKVRKKLQNGFGEAIPIGAKAENVTLNNGTILQDVIEELQTGRAGHADLTQAEYDALPQSQKNDGTIYFVADGAAGTNNAAAVRYSNTGSGLSATNVQSAIDEVNENVETQVSALKAVDATLKDAATKTVANNLVTTSQGYVLDARQGKALQDSVTALNNKLISGIFQMIDATTSSSDLNTIWNNQASNTLALINGQSEQNAPSSTLGTIHFILSYKRISGYGIQICYGSAKVFWRSMTNGSVGSWTVLASAS